MTDKEYEKLKKTLEEETQRRKDLVANEAALADFQKESPIRTAWNARFRSMFITI